MSSSESNSNGVEAKKEIGTGRVRYPNPPEHGAPDPATLRDQWRYAVRQYSKWYSQAWGSAALAGLTFFALGWYIKGSNPIPSLSHNDQDHESPKSKP